ncbi:MAG: DEAD/DEAH box helicase, partial [Betaproteobacteria bacterium]|nr:DEAD/DEAH box helicase [Betaproteobacteria bacterium]
MSSVLHVALDLPIAPYFDYFPGHWALTPGQWVWVPWGQRVRIGLVIAVGKPAQWSPDRIREVLAPVEGLEAIDAWSLSFWQQVADYYHCAIGELLVASLPKALRTVQATSKPLAGPWAAVNKAWQRWQASRPDKPPAVWHRSQLRAQQAEVLDCLIAQPEGFAPSLLHGITGSGKTLVYLSYIRSLIEKNPKAQVLLLVPEIGLTPQLAQTLESALAPSTIAILHSGLADNLRAAVWLAASRGELRLIVGTRSAIFVPLPHLAAIIVDEEHDPSYKQWESVRYQARDLAVWRA